MIRCLLFIAVADITDAGRPPPVFDMVIGSNAPRPRVVHGWSDLNDKYPFVVSIMRRSLNNQPRYLRSCTGSLLTSQFAITAGHCLKDEIKVVRCGNMSTSWNEAECTSNILKLIHHPSTVLSQRSGVSDIGMIQIETLELNTYGKLHSADYRTFMGRAVRYAGFGGMIYSKSKIKINILPKKLDINNEPLQIGEGMVIFDDLKTDVQPHLIVAPKCSKRDQHPYFGDSGGPLFFRDQIIGVVSGAPNILVNNIPRHPGIAAFTPISPYITWIRSIIKFKA